MKKVLLATTALMMVVAAQAALIDRDWSALGLYVTPSFEIPEVSYDGVGWDIAIGAAGSAPLDVLVGNAQVVDSYGWYDGFGYSVPGFNFVVQEGQDVVMRLFNDVPAGSQTHYLDSQAFSLPDLDDANPPSGAQLEVAFDFTGSTWQAIPEPATIGLMGIAGLGMFLARRKVRS